MKKRFLKIAAAALSLAMGVSALTGCNLVTTDNQKDMNLVVAEVSIGGNAPVEKILKKDLLLMYMNYGYSYMNSGSYTMKQVFEMLMNNLVNNVLMKQSAMVDAHGGELADMKAEDFKANKYLTDYEKSKALYNTNKAFNDLIENYIEKDEETEETETTTEETRTAPTGASVYAEKIKGLDKFKEEYAGTPVPTTDEEWEKAFYDDYNGKGFKHGGIENGFDDNMSPKADTEDVNYSEIRSAYNKVLKALEVNGLIGDDFDFQKDDIYVTDYYKDTLNSQEESILLTNYEKKIKTNIIKEVTYNDLSARYKEMYDAQVKGTVSDFEKLISEASVSKPVLYVNAGGYGFVYNLLLGVDDVQKAQIEKINADTKDTAERKEKRNAILAKTTARDLRSTWITAGYDFDYDTLSFTGDYAIAENPLPFKGTVEWLNETEKDDEDYKAKYKATATEYYLDDFIKVMKDYLYGDSQSSTGNADFYRIVELDTAIDGKEFDDKVNELLFAFSTDGGSLNTYKGYTITPVPGVDGSETYMQEFADAARQVITMPRGSCIVAGTDYGYHFIFHSQSLTANSGYPTLTEYLNAVEGNKNWEEEYAQMIADIDKYAEDGDTDSFLYQLQQAYVSSILSTRVTNAQNAVINQYKNKNDDGEYNEYKKDYVKLYTKRYSEYLKEN